MVFVCYLTAGHPPLAPQVNIGQHPVEKSDTVTILEKISHFLDLENDAIYNRLGHGGVDGK